MPAKVEMMIQVCVNGRPTWRKAKSMRAELSTRLTDKEYDRVLTAAVFELDNQVKNADKKKELVAK